MVQPSSVRGSVQAVLHHIILNMVLYIGITNSDSIRVKRNILSRELRRENSTGSCFTTHSLKIKIDLANDC